MMVLQYATHDLFFEIFAHDTFKKVLHNTDLRVLDKNKNN